MKHIHIYIYIKPRKIQVLNGNEKHTKKTKTKKNTSPS